MYFKPRDVVNSVIPYTKNSQHEVTKFNLKTLKQLLKNSKDNYFVKAILNGS